jgi:hypothetical protein
MYRARRAKDHKKTDFLVVYDKSACRRAAYPAKFARLTKSSRKGGEELTQRRKGAQRGVAATKEDNSRALPLEVK